MSDTVLRADASSHASPASLERFDVAEVLALTDQVEAAIAAGEWQQAADLEAQRRATLIGLIERQGVSSNVAAELRDAMAGIASRTYRLIGQAQHHQRALLRDASMIRIGRKAADEYERNGV